MSDFLILARASFVATVKAAATYICSSFMEFDGRFKQRRFSPWKRGRPETKGNRRINLNSISRRFDEDIYYFNMDLSMEVKRAALKAAPSVVSLVSVKGDDPFYFCSGSILDCESINGAYVSNILTSASLMRSRDGSPAMGINKIKVYLADQSLFEGEVFFCDLHYNVAVIKIQSPSPLPTCCISCLDDSISIDSNEVVKETTSETFQLRPHSDSFHLSPGDLVVAVGRFFQDCSLMAAPGTFSIDACNLDCKELFRANCKITNCGVGGPLINTRGQVIGVNFYDTFYTPFLPINIVCKCLEHFKEYGKFRRPHHGMTFTNLYAATVEKLEIGFSDVVKGVLVEKVIADSSADHAGLVDGDIIVRCNGTPVLGVLEFLGVIWDKTGESVEITVVRKNSDIQLKMWMDICETCEDELNRWPLPNRRIVYVEKWRP